MSGKVIGIAIMLSALIVGACIYYLQVYGFYEEVTGGDVTLVSVVSGQPETIDYADLRAIDADSSPIRYRACFTTSMSLPMLSETYEMIDGVEPRNGPGWFDCFDAGDITAQIEAGTALTFVGHKNIAYGVDRIVAITGDGQGYAWHELNECGEKSYDGTVIGETCPERESN